MVFLGEAENSGRGETGTFKGAVLHYNEVQRRMTGVNIFYIQHFYKEKIQ